MGRNWLFRMGRLGSIATRAGGSELDHESRVPGPNTKVIDHGSHVRGYNTQSVGTFKGFRII